MSLMWCDECKKFEEVYSKVEKHKIYINGVRRVLEYRRFYCCNCNSLIR
jgi:hypothetical protein